MIHEVMHVLGHHHEQTRLTHPLNLLIILLPLRCIFFIRFDRDLFLEMQWENMDPKEVGNFEKLPRTVAFPKYPYDFFSVMQYSLDSFGLYGRPSMILAVNKPILYEFQVNTCLLK
jgi:hypothetical protein